MNQQFFRVLELSLILIVGFFVLLTEIRTRIASGKSTFRLPDTGRWYVFINDLFFWSGVTGWVFLGGAWLIWPEPRRYFLPMMPEPVFFLQIIGLVAGVLGVLYIVFGILSLSESFRTSIDYSETIELKTGGIYRFGRNPMAVGLILQGWGLAFMQQSWLALLVALVLHITNRFRVHLEEAFLADYFGEEYRDFCRRTGRFFSLPGRRGKKR